MDGFRTLRKICFDSLGKCGAFYFFTELLRGLAGGGLILPDLFYLFQICCIN